MYKIIDSIKNNEIVNLLKLKEKKYRDTSDSFLVEGYHLVTEANNHGLLKMIITTDKHDFETYKIDGLLVNEKIIAKLATTLTPQNIIGLVKKKEEKINLDQSKLIVVLDNVSDPGNIGTIIRTSAALGVGGIYLTNNSCSVYNEKVIRATQGSIFKIPIMETTLSKSITELRHANFYIYTTSLNTDNTIYQVPKNDKIALIFGNEANGVSDEAIKNSDIIYKIPMKNDVESLNVAMSCGISLFYFKGGR